MQAVFNMFEDRVQEINLYFHAIKELDCVDKNCDSTGIPYYDDKFVKILKANTLLMIYNLVESTIMEGILEIYEKVKQEGLTYAQVSREIKAIWFSYKFKQVYDQQAHYNSYKGKAIEIVNFILDGEVIDLNRKATAISGNLDVKSIKNVFNEHGIVFRANERKSEDALKIVKSQRNSLAHGTLSFVECGRNYSIEDLEKIREEVVIFLGTILEDMKKYYDEKKYQFK
jgi:hypothetical protein